VLEEEEEEEEWNIFSPWPRKNLWSRFSVSLRLDM
jgi:hypothetical protein